MSIRQVAIIGDGTPGGTKVMLGDVDLTKELRIKSLSFTQNAHEEPTVMIEIYGGSMEAKGELFTELIDEGDENTNGDGKE